MTESEYNVMIGQRIHSIRKTKQMTLKELGRLIGLGESTIQRYEKGQIKSIDINILKKIAEAMRVQAAELLDWETTPYQSHVHIESEREEHLVVGYRRLDDRGKETIDRTMDMQLELTAKIDSAAEDVG